MSETRVIIFGASSIVGLQMNKLKPDNFQCINFRRQKLNDGYLSFDLTRTDKIEEIIRFYRPDVVVNLVSYTALPYEEGWKLGYDVPIAIAAACKQYDAHYLHVSSDHVFGGGCAPYSNRSPLCPISGNGMLLAKTEKAFDKFDKFDYWTIARLPFVLGLGGKPFSQSIMLDAAFRLGDEEVQVMSYLKTSVSFADDAARSLWQLVKEKPVMKTFNIGLPLQLSANNIISEVVKITKSKCQLNRENDGNYRMNFGFSRHDILMPVAATQSPYEYFENKLKELYFEWRKTNVA